MHINIVVKRSNLDFLEECLPIVPTKMCFCFASWHSSGVNALGYFLTEEDVLQLLKGIQSIALGSLVGSETLEVLFIWIVGPQLQPFHSCCGLPQLM